MHPKSIIPLDWRSAIQFGTIPTIPCCLLDWPVSLIPISCVGAVGSRCCQTLPIIPRPAWEVAFRQFRWLPVSVCLRLFSSLQSALGTSVDQARSTRELLLNNHQPMRVGSYWIKTQLPCHLSETVLKCFQVVSQRVPSRIGSQLPTMVTHSTTHFINHSHFPDSLCMLHGITSKINNLHPNPILGSVGGELKHRPDLQSIHFSSLI